MNTAERDLLVTLARHALNPSFESRRLLTEGVAQVVKHGPPATPPRLLQELMAAVPPAGQPFPFDHRVAWIVGALALFDTMHGADEGPVVSVGDKVVMR